MKLPIAETFHSIQGEGTYCGTPMFFIRLAGCNVGRFERTPEDLNPHFANLRVFNSNHSICTASDGQHFLCDTDYTKKFEFTAVELLCQAGAYDHVCLTGGEPFIHDLSELIVAFDVENTKVHIETSGTRPIPPIAWPHWITCCPKQGFNTELLGNNVVKEWKFLVGPSFDENYVRDLMHGQKRPIFLQPIGDIHTHLEGNVAKCLDVLKRNPGWKLSAQLHKYIGAR
jgi:organic radical activating enzyme